MPDRLVPATCLAVLSSSTIMLAGWLIDIPLLTKLYPEYESIKPNTTIAFMLSALALWLLSDRPAASGRRWPGIGLAAFVSAIGFFTLVEYALQIEMGVDGLLVNGAQLHDGTPYPGRMSIISAMSFVCIGLALATLDRSAIKGLVLAEQLTLAPLVFSSFALVGYLYNQQVLYKIGPYAALALPSSILFVLLSSGIFMARPDRGLMATLTSRCAGGVVLRRLLPVAIGTPIILGGLRLRGQELGFYDLGFGIALFAVVTTILGAMFLWRFASSLNRTDMQRRRSEHRVRRLLWQAEQREQALREKQAQLVQGAKLASIGELSAGVAHELNNPLNNIGLLAGNALDALRTGKPVQILVPWLEGILKQIERASAIINNLRSFARSAPAKFEPVNVNECITVALALISEQLRLRGVQVHLSLAPDPVTIEGNGIQLQQVFLNLFLNARDAMETVPNRILSIRMDVESSLLTITVRDTGCGIPDDVLERVFDPFFTTKPVGRGTGLGLSISYGIIKEHKGEIQVHQEPTGGTSFVISLPLISDHRPPSSHAGSPAVLANP